jgi:hypothetical protein
MEAFKGIQRGLGVNAKELGKQRAGAGRDRVLCRREKWKVTGEK